MNGQEFIDMVQKHMIAWPETEDSQLWNRRIDALIEMIVMAKNREEQIAATRALDRVLLLHDYVVPQWTYGFSRTARWNRFAHPENMPEYGASAFPTIWWYDEAKAKETASKN